ncbi:alpha-galactosidase [Microlunatus ginsengisoli]|uniref:Alpha-galactosidase n=1 Tax=Microlunatus ginsengisoli TaxID=363863 RepID=A0ABP6ZSB6_9ACTN
MSWTLPTATSRYVVDLAADGGGPVLQDWTAGDVRPWAPSARAGFETEPDRLPSEYSALGTRQVRGADLIVDHGDGLLGARLSWPAECVEVRRDGPRTRFSAQARDDTGTLAIELVIETSTEHDVVAKHVVITNTGEHPVELPRAFGPAWELPIGPGACVDLLAGAWAREFTPSRVTLPAGELSIGSRQGITSHTYSPAVRVSGLADPNGPAFGVALAWSGSWRLLVDAVPFRDRVRIAGGVDDESCVVRLDPGEQFRTPTVLGVHAPDGAAGIRRRWHDHQRGWLARDLAEEHRPIVYNSWYATTFDVRPDHQLALAERAAAIGAEVFVVDDGWFAGRHDDRHGLGDWRPDPVTFPDGLDPLIGGVLDRGLRFGIWVEPEAVNPGAAVLRDHPHWIYRAGDRPLITVRNQYVLDFGRPDVVEWTETWLRELLADERITYLKWDMNRPVSDGGRPGDPYGRQWSVQHAQGYYRVMRMLRDEFPHVTVEACSGGGGRIDPAVLGLCDVVWTSDETGPRDRLAIQHGFLSAYGPHLMSSWVTDEPDRLDRDPASLEFRFAVAMAGVLGIGADLLAWDEVELARATRLVELYRSIRTTVHTGRVEQHGRPGDDVYAIEYGSAAQTAILVYARPGYSDPVRLRPGTLDPERSYRLSPGDRVLTGREAAAGIDVPFALAPDADVLVFEALP